MLYVYFVKCKLTVKYVVADDIFQHVSKCMDCTVADMAFVLIYAKQELTDKGKLFVSCCSLTECAICFGCLRISDTSREGTVPCRCGQKSVRRR